MSIKKVLLTIITTFLIAAIFPKNVHAFTNGLGGWLDRLGINDCGSGCTLMYHTLTWDGVGGSAVRPGQSVWFERWYWHCDGANLGSCDNSNGGTYGGHYVYLGSGTLPSSFKSWSTYFGLPASCGTWQSDIGALDSNSNPTIPGTVAGWVTSTGTSCGGGGGGGAVCGQNGCEAGEDCNNCSTDCGTCGGGGSCGDGSCDGGAGEDCSTCASDCGTCCTPSNPSTPTLSSPVNCPTPCTLPVAGPILTLTWNPVSSWGQGCGGSKNYNVYVSTSSNANTRIARVNRNTTSTDFTGTNGLTYYWRVGADNGPNEKKSNIWSFTLEPPRCTITMTPTSTTIVQGPAIPNALVTTASAVAGWSFVGNPVFTSSNINTLTVANNATNPQNADLTGLTAGTATVTSTCNVTNGTITRSSTDTSSVVVGSAPFWITKGGDVVTFGNISSQIDPTAGMPFIDLGDGGFPGVAIYGPSPASVDFMGNSTIGTPSVKNWLVSSQLKLGRYDYEYFKPLLPTGIVDNVPAASEPGSFFYSGGYLSGGYYWYKRTGDLSLTSVLDLGVSATARKIVIVVDGNLYLNSDIKLDTGKDFILFLVNNNIIVSPVVKDLAGIYLADDDFNTGTADASADPRLKVKGTVIAWGKINLQRNPSSATTEGEKFIYQPDLMVNFPQDLARKPVQQREIVP